METNALTITEQTHINEMEAKLKRRLKDAQRTELSADSSFRSRVLALTVGEDYEAAKESLFSYIRRRTDFPDFQTRAEIYARHCAELIDAINTKRNFQGFGALSLTKQQDIHERVLGHFEELKSTLRRIEKLERDHRRMDSRSTIWVLRAICATALGLCVAWFMQDLYSGLLSSTIHVANVVFDDLTVMIANKIF